MLKLEKKYFWIAGLITTALTFSMILIGEGIILKNNIELKSITVFLGFSLLAGAASAVLMFFRLKIAFLCFILGLAFGIFQMFKMFLNGMSGWGDLVGAFLLIAMTITGLGVGISAQYGFYLYKKLKVSK